MQSTVSPVDSLLFVLVVCLSKLVFQTGKKQQDKMEHCLNINGLLLTEVLLWPFREYQMAKKHDTSIANQLNTQHKKVIGDNRHHLKSIIETILVCARQNVALRGHNEGSDSSNAGNFIYFLNLLGKHDKIVHDHLTSAPKNAKYTSPDIQNDLIKIMVETIRKKISDEINEAGFYSLIVDETKDIGKAEQLSIVIRYVKEKNVHERFLTYVHAEALDAVFNP